MKPAFVGPDIDGARKSLFKFHDYGIFNTDIQLELLAERVVDTILWDCGELDAESGARDFADVIMKLCEAKRTQQEAYNLLGGLADKVDEAKAKKAKAEAAE
jgi:hypothetical protein